MKKDKRLEELSDRIRSGDILPYPLVLEVIQYQEKRKKERKEKEEKLIKTMNFLGYKIIKTGYRNILKKKTLYEYDDFQLKLGFKKVKNIKLSKIQLKFLEKDLFELKPMHMIKANNKKDNLSKIYNNFLNLFKNMNKKKFNKALLALYRIRAEYANSIKNIPDKIFDLKNDIEKK